MAIRLLFMSISCILNFHLDHPHPPSPFSTPNELLSTAFSTIISITSHSPLPLATPFSPSYSHAAVISPFTDAIIPPFDLSEPHPMTLDATPHPEWRTDVANCAQKTGLGRSGMGLELILCGVDQDHMRGEFSSAENRGVVTRAGEAGGTP